MAAPGTIRLNRDFEIRQHKIDDENVCVIVDDFLLDPEALVDFAEDNADRFLVPEIGYPGPLLNLDPSILHDLHRFVLRRMGSLYSYLRSGATIGTGLSMTTFQPHQLSTFQRLCHIDPRTEMDRRQYAALVYLYANEELGGTAFYRWKQPKVIEQALELEYQDPVSAMAFLAEHSATFRKPAQYMTESSELAELISVIPPRFNRLIFYSGEIPHSGHITSPDLLSTDFRQGRLTLNCFANVFPR